MGISYRIEKGHNAERHTKHQRIAEMERFLKKQGSEIAKYDDKLARQLVEQVAMYEKRLVVWFKSGRKRYTPFTAKKTAREWG